MELCEIGLLIKVNEGNIYAVLCGIKKRKIEEVIISTIEELIGIYYFVK